MIGHQYLVTVSLMKPESAIYVQEEPTATEQMPSLPAGIPANCSPQ